MLYEVKSIEGNIQDVDRGKREIVGMFSNYQSPDMVGDVAYKGMFDRTWKETGNRVTLLFEHKTEKVLARKLTLWDDNKGAYHKSILPKTTFNDSVLDMADAGLLSGHSFGYAVVKGPKNNYGGRDLKEVKHFEVTLVGGDWPVHPDTPLLSVKKSRSELIDDEEKLRDEYIKLKSFCYRSTADDEILEHLELVRDTLLLKTLQLQQQILNLSTISTLAVEETPEPQTGLGFDVKSLLAVIEIEKSKTFLTV